MPKRTGPKPPKYVKRFKTRHGREITALRRPGQPLIRLTAPYLSTEWWKQYSAAMAGQPLPEEDSEQPGPIKAGSVAAAIDSLQKTPWYRALAPKSRHAYGPGLDTLRQRWGSYPIAAVTAQRCAALLQEKGDQYGAYNSQLSVMRKLFQHAISPMGLIPVHKNPMIGLEKLAQPKNGGHQTWTEAQIEQYRAAHPIGTMARLALELLDATGARGRSDVIGLGWDNIGPDGILRFTPRKTARSTGAVVTIDPADHPYLSACLALVPTNRIPRLFLISERGRQFSEDHFGDKFRGWVVEADLPKNCTPHGIRKAFGTRLSMNGADPYEIGAALGDSVESVKVYTAARNTELLSLRAQRRLRERQANADLSNPVIPVRQRNQKSA